MTIPEAVAFLRGHDLVAVPAEYLAEIVEHGGPVRSRTQYELERLLTEHREPPDSAKSAASEAPPDAQDSPMVTMIG